MRAALHARLKFALHDLDVTVDAWLVAQVGGDDGIGDVADEHPRVIAPLPCLALCPVGSR